MTNTDPWLPLVKLALFAGVLLMFGPGWFARWVTRFDASSTPAMVSRAALRRLNLALLVGLALVILVSLLDVALTAQRALGYLDAGFLWSYLTASRHGQTSLARVGLAVALFGLGLGVKANWREWVFHAALGLALLVTVSLTSHAAADGRVLPLVGDVLHLMGMTVWLSAVLGLAWAPVWRQALNEAFVALKRVSLVAAICVGLLALTGLYAALTRFYAPEAVTQTPYGQALILKLFALVPVLALAALNRFYWLPKLEHTQASRLVQRFGQVLKLESLLLGVVLLATANLVTQPPPQPPASLKNEVAFDEQRGDWHAVGKFVPNSGGANLEISVRDKQGKAPPEAYLFSALVSLADHPMQPIVMKVKTTAVPGRFTASTHFWMGGKWQASLRMPDNQVILVTLRAR